MAHVEIYTWQQCPFCKKAKALLESKNVDYVEHKVDGDEAARDVMAQRGSDGKRSVPQVFINNQHVGGCDALHALEAAGKLDGLLKA
jgi:glutaredoxin 3